MKMTRLFRLLLVLAPLTSNAWDAKPQTPKDMFLEAKLSPWLPNLDGSAGSNGPYTTTFGGTPMLLGEVELDYQVFQKFGSLAVGLSVGYAEKFAKAVIEGTTQRSGESTGVRVVPMKAMAVYRFDLLWLRWEIPLVPYVKGGAVFMPWWVTKGADIEKVVTTDGRTLAGLGNKFGLVGVIGLSLTLDFLDRRLARDFDSSMGVNHSYLFAEFTAQKLSFDVSSGTVPLDFSSLHWMFGLGFEF